MMPEMGFGHVLLLLFFGFFFSLLYITHCIGAVEFDFIVIVKKYTIASSTMTSQGRTRTGKGA